MMLDTSVWGELVSDMHMCGNKAMDIIFFKITFVCIY